MRLLRRLGIFSTCVALVACERSRSAVPVDSTAIRARLAEDSAARAASPTRNWDSNAGPVLLVAASSPAEAYVVPPDSALAAEQLARVPHPAAVILFGRNGTVQTAELPNAVDTAVCAVATLTAAPPPRPWSVGFIGGVVAPVAMDSLQSLSPVDSTVLSTGMIGLASTLPEDAAGRFSGLPFVVRSLWRFTIADGSQVVAAALTRQINQEATPLEERTFLVAERPAGDPILHAAYSERSSGDEETVESRDVLAAVLIGSRRTPALVISHDFGDGTSYGLIERFGAADWRSRWLSRRGQCEPASDIVGML